MKKINVLMIAMAMLFGQAVPAQTLKVYLPFNGNTADQSGHNIHPTYVGAGLTSTADRFGQSSAAYAFDGANGSYLRVPADQLPTGDRTVSLWFRAADVSSRPVVLSYGGNSFSAPGSSYFMGVNLGGASTYQVSGHFGSNTLEHAYSAAPVNQWIHWVVTIEGSTQKSFINGQLVASGSFNFPTFVAGKDLAMGVATSTTGIAPYSDINVGYFQGSLDEVRIYDGALTESQVLNLYTQESTPPITGDFYVNDNNTNGDVFTSAIGNDANNGTAAAPFATIQHAVSVAPAGSTIYVDAGTYEPGDITIAKELKLSGSNYNLSPNNISDPLQRNASRNAEAIVLNSTIGIGSSGIELKGFTLDPGNKSAILLSNTSITNNDFGNFTFSKNILKMNNTSSFIRMISLTGKFTTATSEPVTGGFTIEDNRFEKGSSVIGLFINLNSVKDVQVKHNSFVSTANLTKSFQALNVGSSPDIGSSGIVQNVLFANNLVNEAYTVWSGHLIGSINVSSNRIFNTGLFFTINTTMGESSSVAVTNNELTNTYAGIPYMFYTRSGVSIAGTQNLLLIENNTITGQSAIGENNQSFQSFYATYNNTVTNSEIIFRRNKIQYTGDFSNVQSQNVAPVILRGNILNATVEHNEFLFTNSGSLIGTPEGSTLPENPAITIGSDFSTAAFMSSTANILITGNKISGFKNSIAVYDLSATGRDSYVGYGNLPAGATVTVVNNSFVSDELSVNNGNVGETVTATCNWFGSSQAFVVATKISSANVTYSPWLTNGTDADPTTIGFQPLPDICNGTAVNASISIQTNISCFDGNNGAADITISGGVFPYTFIWSKEGDAAFSQTDEDLNNATAGNYSLLITDAVGTTDTINVSISEPAELVIDVTGSNVSCFGGANGAATVTVSGGTGEYSYLWNNGSTTASITGLVAGDYLVSITDINGCVSKDSISIIQPSAVTLDFVITNVTNSGSLDGVIEVIAQGNTPPYSYSLDGSNYITNNVFNGLGAGNYTVYVKDANGCEYSTTATLTEPASQPNLKLYFPFTGNTNDASGNNINPTYTGAGLAPATDRFGQSSAAYAFDGANGSYLRVPADQLPTGDRTVSLWFRAADVSSRPVVLSYGGNSFSAPGSSYFMGVNLGGASTYQVSGHFGSNTLEHAYSAAPVNQWIHWVVTIEGSTQKSFINGQLVASGSFNFPTFVAGKDLAMGVATSTTGIAPYSDINVGYFQGSLDEVRIYDGALTESQVLNLYTQESTPPITGDFYVNDNNTNGDVFTSAIGNDANAGTAAAPFATIQYAVSVAPAGSTIYVDAGTYIEQVTINKGLTITGGGAAKTFVTLPATTAPAPGTFTEMGTFQTTQNIGDVHLSDISITGRWIAGQQAITPVIIQAGGSVRNANLQGGNQGVFFRVESAVKNALVENSVIDAEYVGVNFSGEHLTSSLINNLITLHNSSFSAGVFGSKDFTATGNDIRGFYTFGIQAGHNNTINNNSITGVAGLAIQAAVPVDATCNWLGTALGSLIETKVSPGVTFTPWLTNGTDADAVAGGFQPLPDICNGTPIVATLVGSTNITCFAGNNGTADVNMDGGVQPFSFAWSKDGDAIFSQNAEDLINATAGSYTLLVTDETGATTTINVNLSEPAELQAVLAGNNVNCFGGNNGSASVTATGGTGEYTYLWSNGNATSAANGLLAGIYTVTVTDEKGCTVQGSYTVTEPAELRPPNVRVTNISCNGLQDGRLTLIGRGGTPPYRFSLDGLLYEEANEFPALAAGTYNLYVKDANDCEAVGQATIAEPDPVVVVVESAVNSCPGLNSGAINLQITGGTPKYSVAWVGPGGYSSSKEDINSLTVGEYMVTVTDVNGCVSTATALIETQVLPVINGEITPVSCYNESNGSINLQIPPGSPLFTFAWTGPNGFKSSAEDITGLKAGRYSVTLTSSEGCATLKTFEVAAAFPLSLSATDVEITTCERIGTIVATGIGGKPPYMYSLNGGQPQSQGTFSNLPEGKYTLTVIDENGCVAADNDVNIVDNGTDAYESNNTIVEAKSVNLSSTLQARLFSSKKADADWYHFSVPTTGQYNLNWSHPTVQQSFGVYTLNKNKSLALAVVGEGSGYKSYNLTAGVNYYLGVTGTQSLECYAISLQQVNNERRTVQSQEKKELVIRNPEFKATAFPNPHRGAITIRVESPFTALGDLLFYDFTGRLVKSRQLHLQQGINTIRIDNLRMVSMIYTVKVGGQVVSGKILAAD